MMLTSLATYVNSRRDVDWNTCGQAAIASLLDFHGIDPWGLPRNRAGRWDAGAAIDAVVADGFGPDIIFGWGTSGGRIAKALQHYGLIARGRALVFDGGWETAWPELRNMLDRNLPVPVMLDLGRLEGRNYQFHWAIAYAYDQDTVSLASVGVNRPTHQKFLDAWRCDFIFIPFDMKFAAVHSLATSKFPLAQGDHAEPGEALPVRASLTSPNGRYTLRYQDDGNLVLYRNQDGRALWDTRTGSAAGFTVMQDDGNLVIYDARLTPAIWSTGTFGNPGARLVLQDDGNLVIYRRDGTPAWASNTVQPNVPSGTGASGEDMNAGEVLTPGTALTSADGRFSLVYQGDGNLVLYRNRDGAPAWASNTAGTNPGVAILQGDGNLVVYDATGTAVFSSGSWGNPGSCLLVQDDANVVIYHPDGHPLWSSGSAQWSAVPSGNLVTTDGDHISYTITPGAVAADRVEFVLELGVGVTWTKSLLLPDGEGSTFEVTANGAGGHDAEQLWTHQVDNGQQITFQKAKFLGVMTPVLSIGDLTNLTGGCRVTFQWDTD